MSHTTSVGSTTTAAAGHTASAATPTTRLAGEGSFDFFTGLLMALDEIDAQGALEAAQAQANGTPRLAGLNYLATDDATTSSLTDANALATTNTTPTPQTATSVTDALASVDGRSKKSTDEKTEETDPTQTVPVVTTPVIAMPTPAPQAETVTPSVDAEKSDTNSGTAANQNANADALVTAQQPVQASTETVKPELTKTADVKTAIQHEDHANARPDQSLAELDINADEQKGNKQSAADAQTKQNDQAGSETTKQTPSEPTVTATRTVTAQAFNTTAQRQQTNDLNDELSALSQTTDSTKADSSLKQAVESATQQNGSSQQHAGTDANKNKGAETNHSRQQNEAAGHFATTNTTAQQPSKFVGTLGSSASHIEGGATAEALAEVASTGRPESRGPLQSLVYHVSNGENGHMAVRFRQNAGALDVQITTSQAGAADGLVRESSTLASSLADLGWDMKTSQATSPNTVVMSAQQVSSLDPLSSNETDARLTTSAIGAEKASKSGHVGDAPIEVSSTAQTQMHNDARTGNHNDNKQSDSQSQQQNQDQADTRGQSSHDQTPQERRRRADAWSRAFRPVVAASGETSASSSVDQTGAFATSSGR